MRNRTIAIAAAIIAAAAITTACSDDNDEATHGGMTMHSTSATSEASAADHNDADIAFAQQMIPHHAQAVEMSEIVLAKPGIDPRVTGLANQIKAAQAPEIEQMQSWLAEWDQPSMPMGTHMTAPPMRGGMMGMMSEQDMAALQDAEGVDAARLYLTQMIAHHEGAIDMAQKEIESGSNADAIALAQAIVTTQQAEITTMEQLLMQL
ncbi:DUF305 domain-containing protein [Aldersonia kunmingensis]|uniref:DUF305 domain-containing protein n=1 Tax=Aldersonia kunmingensis TaxID=408066 RepID=UPI00082FD401|nr:DUF305 domain-containing protein [Aldersonia kunmingensis]